MSFFKSGAVDTKSFDRSKLSEGTYRVRLVDLADHIGANSGSRTQFDFVVLKGPNSIGLKKGHIVMHKHEKSWQEDKARGEIAAFLGAFMGLVRDDAGFKITHPVYDENSRTVTYANGGKDVASQTRASSELPLVKASAEAILVVKPYFVKGTGERKRTKDGSLSVVYEMFPLSCGFVADELGAEPEAAPAAPSDDEPETDPLDLALADGWRANGPSYFFKKGEPQIKADALRAKYAGGGQ